MDPNDDLDFDPTEWDTDSRTGSQLLGVSTMTMTTYAKSGKLPARKLPGLRGAYRFRRRDVLSLLKPVKADA